MGKNETEKPPISSKSKKEKLLFPTKVVIRRLPPSLTKEQLIYAFGDLPEHDFFYFVGSDMSFGPISFSRAYINFRNREDIIKFRDQFDGFCFEDSRGVEYPAVVEYAPYQGVPKDKARKDPKNGTILTDPEYLAFLESLNEAAEPPPSVETHLEQIEARNASGSAKTSTPLLEFLKMKRNSRSAGRPSSNRGTPEKKRRPEKEESKSPKKSSSLRVSNNKDSIAKSNPPPKEEKPKDEKKHELKEKDGNRKRDEHDGKGKKESKFAQSAKEKSELKHSPKAREEKGRPDSGRSGRRSDDRRCDDRCSDDRRNSNRRNRRDSSGNDRGRDDHFRGSDSGRRDRRYEGRKDSRPVHEPESKAKGIDSKSAATDGSPIGKDGTELRCKVETENKEKDGDEAVFSSREETKRSDESVKQRARLRNKDRPDRAIYQPRSATRASSGKSDSPKSTDISPDKDKVKEPRPREKGRERDHDTRKIREDKDRDRDRRDRRDRRERDRDRDERRERRGDRERPREKIRERDYREKDTRKERKAEPKSNKSEREQSVGVSSTDSDHGNASSEQKGQ